MQDKDEGITSQVYEVSPSGVQRLVVMQRECLLQPCLDPRARICITARVSTSAKLWPGNQRRVIKAGLIHTCTLPEFGQQAHFRSPDEGSGLQDLARAQACFGSLHPVTGNTEGYSRLFC